MNVNFTVVDDRLSSWLRNRELCIIATIITRVKIACGYFHTHI